jgi:hypothetical protein
MFLGMFLNSIADRRPIAAGTVRHENLSATAANFARRRRVAIVIRANFLFGP